MDIETQDVSGLDPVFWLSANRIRVDGKPFDLANRRYQHEMMRPCTRQGVFKHNECVRKGSQIGVTIGKVGEASHGALHRIYPQGIGFYFPTQKAVEIFSASRWKPFIEDNPDTVGQYMGSTDRVDMRRMGDVNIYFFGGTATVRIQDKKDSAAVRMTPMDWVIVDERDLFDDEMARQLNQRLGNSQIERRSDLGSPSIPDYGIDLLYKLSDQRRWQIPCECRKFTCIETEFPRCVKTDDERGHIICVHCNRPINRNAGEWEPDYLDRELVGYWPSQLLNPNCNINLTLKKYVNPEAYQMTEGEFQRTVLGEPYINAEDELTESDVYACCTNQRPPYDSKHPTAMGVDVNWPQLNVVIGYPLDRKRFKILRVAVVTEFIELMELAKRYNTKSCVIDAQPERHKVAEFQKETNFSVWACFYSDHLKVMEQWDNDNKKLVVNRTQIFDYSHELIKKPGMCQISYPASSGPEEIRSFAHQMTRSVRVLDTDEKTGTKVYRYRTRGDKQDHYRSACNYFLLACKKVAPVQTRYNSPKKPVMQDMTYAL